MATPGEITSAIQSFG